MNTLIRHPRGRSAQAGFSLLEALVALVVMAFGMLALSGMQLNLSRNADIAKQRIEATRIAQARIEQARSFTSMTANVGQIDWANLQADVAAPPTVTTNTTYNVTVTVGGAVTDPMRAINVQVAWADRAGEVQQVAIATVISRTDPRDPGFIGNPLPLNTPLRRPLGRSIDIPIPAIDLGGGVSATQFDANYVAIFSNLTGGVVQICNPNQANANAAAINAAIAGSQCETITGFIIGGYIGRTSTGLAWPTGGAQGGINYAGVTRNTVPTGTYSAIRCLYSDATDQNTGTVITVDNGYKYYICVVPLAAPYTWGGTIRLGGIVTTSDRIVCRYQYTQTNITPNERNVQPYVGVNASIDEQNYLLATSNSSFAGSLAGQTGVCPSSMTVAGVSVGVVHQDCRSANPGRTTECPAPSVP